MSTYIILHLSTIIYTHFIVYRLTRKVLPQRQMCLFIKHNGESIQDVNSAINVEHNSNAVTHLKSKNDNFEGLTFDNFRSVTHLLSAYTCISLLFSAVLSHGTSSAGLFLLTMVPLIKNKCGNKYDSNNYRAIAIAVFSVNYFTPFC